MKNYTLEYEGVEIESLIPKLIIENIKTSLKKLDEEFKVTPLFIVPEDLSIIFGIIDKDSSLIEYQIKITKNLHNKQ